MLRWRCLVLAAEATRIILYDFLNFLNGWATAAATLVFASVRLRLFGSWCLALAKNVSNLRLLMSRFRYRHRDLMEVLMVALCHSLRGVHITHRLLVFKASRIATYLPLDIAYLSLSSCVVMVEEPYVSFNTSVHPIFLGSEGPVPVTEVFAS